MNPWRGLFLSSLFVIVALLCAVSVRAQTLPSAIMPPYSTVEQLSRSVPYTVRVTPTEAGVVATFPTTWTRGAKVVSIRGLQDTTAVLYLESVGTGLANLIAIDKHNMKVLLPGESRSIGEQTTSVGLRIEVGYGDPSITGKGVSHSIHGFLGGPVEVSGWR